MHHHATTRVPLLPVMIELADISTPRQQAIVARIGPVDLAVVDAATTVRIQAIPVVDADGASIGVVETSRLAQLAAMRQALTPDAVTTDVPMLPYTVPVPALVHLLAATGMVLHAADPDDIEFSPDWFGIVTVADLNRPVFRAHVYQMVVVLETSLGQLIMDEFGDDWGAIRLLSEGTQRRVREFWEEERNEGIDLSPIMTVTLSDLFHIAVESHRVWRLAGYDNPAQLRDIAHEINDLRNVIMHPVRPLIVNRHDLLTLDAGLQQLDHLTSAIMKRIGVLAG